MTSLLNVVKGQKQHIDVIKRHLIIIKKFGSFIYNSKR